MIASTASSHRQIFADRPVGDADPLEAALARTGWRLTFDPALEAAYESAAGSARLWRHVVCDLLGLASFWLLSALDAGRIGTERRLLLEDLRTGVVLVSLTAILLLLGLCRGRRPRLRETLSTAGLLAVVSYSIVAARLMPDAKTLLQGSGLLLIFLHTGLAARLQFRFAVGVNLFTWLGYALFAQSRGPDAAAMLHNHLMLFAVVVLFSTVGNFMLDFRERRNYLLECLQARQHAALFADAESLKELTLRDGLTGLFNRRHLDTEMARLCAGRRRGSRPAALLQVDVDHFKRYNDRYGHPAGDRCLADIGAALAVVAERHGGLAARVGGEEFALLLPSHDADQSATAAAEVCEAVRALGLPHADSPVAAHVTVSVGAAASAPAPGVWASTLTGAADAALYAAKRRGRDRWVRFDAALEPVTSPRVRTSVDSLPAEARAPADELAAVARLSALRARGLGWLRFPADIESSYQERGAPERRRQLAFLMSGGLAMLLVYAALCRPVFPDIADTVVRHLLALSMGAIGLAALNLKFPFGWRLREGLVTLTISVFGLAIVWMESLSRAPTVYSATLGVCLLPMFGCLIVAQPFRFSLVPSSLICLGIATLMSPAQAERRESWFLVLCIVCLATLFSLVGGYLLELADRRAYLLDRLRLAQLAVLRHNTLHLKRLATIDPLTRLPNRRHFEAELGRLAATCSGAQEPLGLLILDLDHFKRFNDGYGHPAGDACLQRVGAALLQWAAGGTVSGRTPIAARIGGEEFGVLLPGSDASAALAAAQRLRLVIDGLRIEHVHSPDGRFLTVSIGAASLVLASHADDRELLKAADAALYRAKGLGRARAAA